MSLNPYASESSSRMKVKAEKSFEEQKAQREYDAEHIENPLMEGKKMDMNKGELKTFAKAMETEQFRDMLGDYVNEISDPKHKPEMQEYLRQMERQGDLPAGTKLIRPRPGYCIKTTIKKMVSEKTKSFFDQKLFINVAFHEDIEKPKQEQHKRPDGSTGVNWSLPYRVSKLRHDQDNKKQLVSTYDIVFHEEVTKYLIYDEFKKFVSDTAIDGVQRVCAEDKETVSSDYKILQNMTCKGGEPCYMTIKVETGNPLIDNMELDNVQTRLEKEIMKDKNQQIIKEEKEKEQKRIAAGGGKKMEELHEESSSDEDVVVEEKPTGIIQPRFKLVYAYPVDMGDSWGGYTTSQMDHEKMMRARIPTEITITINLKWADNMKGSNLDINEGTLIFEIPELYYLDIQLKYKVDQDGGSAKFDKTKKELKIVLPVTGLNERSAAEAEIQYQIFVVDQEKRIKELQLQGDNQLEEEEMAGPVEITDDVDQAAKALQDAFKSKGKGHAKRSIVMDGEEKIDDQYNFEQTLIDGELDSDEEDEEEDNQGPDMLKVYQEEEEVDEEIDTDLKGNIKIHGDEEEDMDLKIPGNESKDGVKPMIQEISSTKATKRKAAARKTQVKAEKPKPVFSWEKAERVDSEFTFMNQGELVFVNFKFKGYNKESDARYAISENEIFLEVRDESKNKVHKVCKTLQNQIVVKDSTVQLLTDFIIFKLQKKEKNESWDCLGFDVNEFNSELNGKQIELQSNFIKNANEQDKENQKPGTNAQGEEEKDYTTIDEKAKLEQEKLYTPEGIIDPSKKAPEDMTREEKETLAKKLEDEAIERIIKKARTQMQSSCVNINSDVMGIY